MPPLTFELLEHRDLAVATLIHKVQLAAYSQEARLLGVAEFPPLRRTVEDIRTSPEQFLGATRAGALLGLAGLEPGGTPEVICITSLVVAPSAQRSGIGSALLQEVRRRYPTCELSVSTAAANAPALALYSRAGFLEVSRCTRGALELVRMEQA